MARMGKSTYLTRFAAPAFSPSGKKEAKWYVKASPGPHPLLRSIPLGSVLRDALKVVSTMSEAKKLLALGSVLVDGRPIRDHKFPIGLMDVIAFPSAQQYFRVLPDNVKYLRFMPISAEESKYKYVRIIGKTMTNGSKIQLNLEDGRNIRIPLDKYKAELEVETLTTIKLNMEDGTVVGKFPLREGAYAVSVAGRNVGLHGSIKEIRSSQFKSKRDSLVTVESQSGESFQTKVINIMSIGDQAPDLRLA